MGSGKLIKNMVKAHNKEYIKQTTETYSKYKAGSPTFLTYFKKNINKTRNDGTLETTHTLIGNATSKKYDKIEGVPVWGTEALKPDLGLDIGTIRTTVGGNLNFVSGSLVPSVDDFFSFEMDDTINKHLFRITNVEFDKINSNKEYLITFELYQGEYELIYSNIVDNYVFLFDNIGSKQNTLIKKEALVKYELLQEKVDYFIDRYIELFYKDEFDTFVFEDGNEDKRKIYYSPYVVRFINEYKVVEKYNQELLTEIYVNKIDETNYGFIFNNEIWLDNILYKLIKKKLNLIEFKDSFVFNTGEDLKQWKKLPFYQCDGQVTQLTFLQDEQDTNTIQAELALKGLSFLDSKMLGNMIPLSENYIPIDEVEDRLAEINQNAIIYAHKNNEIKRVFIVEHDEEFNKKVLVDITARDLFDSNSLYRKNPVINLIRKYVNNKFDLNDDLIIELENTRIRKTLTNYMLLPVLIAIIKEELNKKI